MPEQLFTDDEVWLGGYYELAMEVGPRCDERLQAALSALWSHPNLEGCFRDRTREPSDQQRIAAALFDDGWGAHLLGIARLPNGCKVACGSCLVREANDGPDWLDFYLPMGSLATAYPIGGFPIDSPDERTQEWRQAVDDLLAGIGKWIAQSVSYRLGIIGFEVSGHVYAADIARKGIPDKRYIGYLWPREGKIAYYPRDAS
jgi:hypothetical protein